MSDRTAESCVAPHQIVIYIAAQYLLNNELASWMVEVLYAIDVVIHENILCAGEL